MTFPDVFLFRASFRPSDVGSSHVANPASTTSIFAMPPNRQTYHGYNDIGTSVWGLEPSQLVLNRAFSNFESLYWNPYSYAGGLGVESMTDSKFSVFSILVALLGGRSSHFTFAYLSILVFSLYFLIRVLTQFFQVSLAGATLASLVFILNGFHSSNLSNILVHPYLLTPFLLYSLLALRRNSSAVNILQCIFGHTVVLATLFPPSILFSFGFSYGVLLVTSETEAKSKSKFWGFAEGATCLLISICLLSPLLVPLVKSWTVVETFSYYSSRTYSSADMAAVLSFFSPRHLWESYNSFEIHRTSFKDIGWLEASWIHHMGIVALALASFSLFNIRKLSENSRNATVLLSFFAFCAAGRALNCFPFTYIDLVPVVRSIQPGYWGCLLALSITFLVGIGAQSLVSTLPARRGQLYGLLVTLFVISLIAFVCNHLGWIFPNTSMLHLSVMVLIASSFGLLVAGTARNFIAVKLLVPLLIALMLGEYFFYTNHLRPLRPALAADSKAVLPFVETLSDKNFRTLSVGRDVLPPEWGAAYGVRQADGFRESVLPWYKTYFHKALGKPRQDLSFDVAEVPKIHLDLASFLSIKYFLVSPGANAALEHMKALNLPLAFSSPKVTIFENTTAKPRAQLFSAVTDGKLPESPVTSQSGHFLYCDDPLFLQEAEALGLRGAGPDTVEPSSDSKVQIVSESSATVVIAVESPRAAVLSLSDAWHPNWRVEVNGQEARLGRANGAFRAVIVPPGNSSVVFSYQVASQGLIFLLMATGALATFGLVYLSRRS